MPATITRVLLADDDIDDCLLFEESLKALPVKTKLDIVHNGDQLMQWLKNKAPLPHVIFLDLNMPRKNGFECLAEIKAKKELRNVLLIIISTSSEPDIVSLLHDKGAYLYIIKPNHHIHLKNLIQTALNYIMENKKTQPKLDKFVLKVK